MPAPALENGGSQQMRLVVEVVIDARFTLCQILRATLAQIFKREKRRENRFHEGTGSDRLMIPGDWYFLTVLALLLLGTQRFLYKVAAEKGCDTARTTMIFMITVTLLSGAAWVLSGEPVGRPLALIGIAAANSLAFATATIMHMEALKQIPAAVVYPLIRLNVVLVVLFSVAYFGERLTGLQALGILAAVGAGVLLAQDAGGPDRGRGNNRRGLLCAGMSLLAGAAASVSSKFAALYTGKLGFMAVSYAMGTLFAWLMPSRLQARKKPGTARDAFALGLAMGLLNFAGFYLFLEALSRGPLSLIVTIMGLHFLVALLLSAGIYRERFHRRRGIAVALAMASLVLLRLQAS